MELDKYLTVDVETTAQFVEQRSRFIGYIAHVENECDALEYIKNKRNEFHDARHVCYAFKLRDGSVRSNDDGEPSGTAGRPILGRIESAGLLDVVAVVIRYFGGVKLGTSGLIKVYRMATELVLDEVPIVERNIYTTMRCSFYYEQMNSVMQMVKKFNIEVRDRSYQDTKCTFILGIKPSMCSSIISYVLDLRKEIELEKV